ncbi:Golgi SNAP receptor complex member 2-like [Corticium candelabrum]|uniref:Golgi SNAP receptor complex member 2-like n=1 Tax=Corticium candelabrum TaxID=121492 RepID=UPI002E268F72|nr:Golgi SNAP receptor complex member 2-like [Corticium candelabrum]XP_062518928.1 Golgi SNAP receptor complex member 2-like [Corticium candelabrum]
MVTKEPPSRKQSAKLRVEQLSYDCQHLHSTLRTFQQKQRLKEKEEHGRNELLSRRFTANETPIAKSDSRSCVTDSCWNVNS